MSDRVAHERAAIEAKIRGAREKVGETIDELDLRIRGRLDIGKILEENATELVATGAVAGFLLGYGVPRVLTRALQLGIPVGLALVVVARGKRNDVNADEVEQGPADDEGQ